MGQALVLSFAQTDARGFPSVEEGVSNRTASGRGRNTEARNAPSSTVNSACPPYRSATSRTVSKPMPKRPGVLLERYRPPRSWSGFEQVLPTTREKYPAAEMLRARSQPPPSCKR